MGIDLNTAQLLIRAHKNGTSFGRVATLGRQRLLGNRQSWVSVLRKSGYELPNDYVSRLLDPKTEYAEIFLSLLGATEVVAIDVSDYEGAQILHDMNRPIPDNLASSFDIVLDGGTLEHVFDLATALRNAAQMVRPNGRFVSVTMANNFCGHGFYQFSPELYYRFFSPGNGYAMESCIMWEDAPRSRFYQVPDPDDIHARINLTSDIGAFMLIQAKRLGNTSREFIPLQSDYVRAWDAGSTEASEHPTSWVKLKILLKQVPTLKSAVISVRKLLQYDKFSIVAQYRRLRIKRNKQGVLAPITDIRVISGGYFRQESSTQVAHI